MITYGFSLHCISQFIWVEGAGDREAGWGCLIKPLVKTNLGMAQALCDIIGILLTTLLVSQKSQNLMPYERQLLASSLLYVTPPSGGL